MLSDLECSYTKNDNITLVPRMTVTNQDTFNQQDSNAIPEFECETKHFCQGIVPNGQYHLNRELAHFGTFYHDPLRP